MVFDSPKSSQDPQQLHFDRHITEKHGFFIGQPQPQQPLFGAQGAYDDYQPEQWLDERKRAECQHRWSTVSSGSPIDSLILISSTVTRNSAFRRRRVQHPLSSHSPRSSTSVHMHSKRPKELARRILPAVERYTFFALHGLDKVPQCVWTY